MAFPLEAIEDALKMAISQAGYNSLSCEQHETIINFVRGKDVFVSLPTGAGNKNNSHKTLSTKKRIYLVWGVTVWVRD